MQSLSLATNGDSVAGCTAALIDAVPPVTWVIRRLMRSHRSGLSVPQFRSLFLVEREPCASLSGVAEFLGSSLPTASRIIEGLVRKGLIQRKVCTDDRRQVSLVITARGKAVMNSAIQETNSELATEVARFTSQEREVLSNAMEILRSRFGSLTSATETGNQSPRAPATTRARQLRVAVRS